MFPASLPAPKINSSGRFLNGVLLRTHIHARTHSRPHLLLLPEFANCVPVLTCYSPGKGELISFCSARAFTPSSLLPAFFSSQLFLDSSGKAFNSQRRAVVRRLDEKLAPKNERKKRRGKEAVCRAASRGACWGSRAGPFDLCRFAARDLALAANPLRGGTPLGRYWQKKRR